MIDNNEKIKSIFSKVSLSIEQDPYSEVIFAFNGLLTEDNSINLCHKVEELLIEKQLKKGLVRRIFTILVEAFQNVRKHSIEEGNSLLCSVTLSTKTLSERLMTYQISVCNIIDASIEEELTRKIDFLNSLNERDLKQYYLKVLDNGEMSTKGGAGLGLITISMKSKNKLTHTYHVIDQDSSVFQMGCELSG